MTIARKCAACPAKIHQSNRGGLCRACFADAAHSVARACARCPAPVKPDNRTGLCLGCYNAARKPTISAYDAVRRHRLPGMIAGTVNKLAGLEREAAGHGMAFTPERVNMLLDAARAGDWIAAELLRARDARG
jgi:hypothetical protein